MLSTSFIWSDKKIGQTHFSYFSFSIIAGTAIEDLISQSPYCGSWILNKLLTRWLLQFVHYKFDFISKLLVGVVNIIRVNWQKIEWTYFSNFFQAPPFFIIAGVALKPSSPDHNAVVVEYLTNCQPADCRIFFTF